MGRSAKTGTKSNNKLEPIKLEPTKSSPPPTLQKQSTPPSLSLASSSSSSSPKSSSSSPPSSLSTSKQPQLKRHSQPHDGPSSTPEQSRPKRRATNAHIIRFLQTRNPNRLEEEDLKRALEASLEEHPDFWPAEDTASCSSSDQSNAPSASSNSSSTGGGRLDKDQTSAKTTISTITNATNTSTKRRKIAMPSKRGIRNSSAMQQNHQFSNICNCQHTQQTNTSIYQISHPTCSATTHCCPMSTVHNRYKPVTKKNIYSESDFFHDGIMEYIEYELMQRGVLARAKEQADPDP